MTRLKLMSYPDKGGVEGWQLVPEASFPPRISANGRVYSFTVRPGLRFADVAVEPCGAGSRSTST